MVQTRSIDSVIKKIISSKQATGSNEERFSVHKDRREIVSNPWLWQSVDYYLVSFSSFAECKNLPYRIDFASGGFIDLSIDYRVSCNQENGRQVVLALHGNSPLEELERKIKAWIAKHIEGNTHRYVSDLNAWFSVIWQIQQDLAQKIRAEIGLDFESRISIVGVSNLSPFTIEANGLSCPISDFSSSRSLNITIDYRATCDSSSIDQAVSALYGNVAPINVLNERVKRWVGEFSDNRAAQIIDNFDLEIGNLRANLRERARKEAGLNFEARISSDFQQVRRVDPEQLKPFETELISLPIRIGDYDQELELQLEVILDVDPENQDRAFRNRGREFLLLTAIREEVKKYFLLNVNLHKFCTDLQYSVRQELEASLNRALADKGRKVAYLSLGSKAIEEILNRLNLTPFLEIQNFQIECPLQDLKKPIRVNNSINLQLFDLSRYRNAVANRFIPLDEYGKPQLEKWAKQTLERKINSILPKEDFLDLLLEFEPIVSGQSTFPEEQEKNKNKKYYQKIFNAFEADAKTIGYAVNRLISEPELEVRETLALKDFLEINNYFITCAIKDFDESIQIRNTLNLRIIDTWKYSIAVKNKQIPIDGVSGKPDLEQWIKQQLIRIIKPLLLNTELIDLLPGKSISAYTEKVSEEIQKAAGEIGYEVVQIVSTPEVEVKEKLALKEFLEINDYFISCTIKDFDESIQIRNTLNLRIIDTWKYSIAVKNKQIPIDGVSGKPDLEQWIKQQLIRIIKPLLLNTELIDLLPGKSISAYTEKVSEEIQKAAGEIGYEVVQIVSTPEVEVKEKLALKEFLEINNYSISCTAKGFGKPIEVRNTLHLRLEDNRKYSVAVKNKQIPVDEETGKPNLEQWAKKELEQIVKTLLLNTKLVTLLPKSGTEDYAKEVFKDIEDKTAAIGYRVAQIISIPELDKIRVFTEKFTIETRDEEYLEYPTKDASCRVKLEAIVVIKISNLQAIGDILESSETDFKEQIKKRIYEAISRIMNGIEPDRFFMGFTPCEARKRGEAKSVEQELSEAIDQELKNAFKAVVINITLKPVDTEITKLFKSLRGSKDNNFQIEFQPISDDIEKVTFTGKFQVLSVADGDWYKFENKFEDILEERQALLNVINDLKQERLNLQQQVSGNSPEVDQEIDSYSKRIQELTAQACGIDRIRQNIESDFKPIVCRLKGDAFRYSSIQDLEVIKNNLNNWMKEGDGSIRDLYGLEVKVSQLDCPIKESEEGIADKYFAIDEIREEVKLKQQQDKKLREKILALTEDIGSDDRAEEEIDKIKNYRKTLKVEIEDLNRQLENEKQRLKSSESESRRDSINLLQSGIPKQRNLLEETQETESQFHQSQTTPHSSSQEDEIEPSLKTVDAEVIDDDSSN